MTDEATQPKDRWFDPWMTAKGEPLRGLSKAVAEAVERHERETGLRKRARRKTLGDFLRRVEGMVANLAFTATAPGDIRPIVLSLHKGTGRKSRYDSPMFDAETLPPLLVSFEGLGLIAVQKGDRLQRRATTILPTSHFVEEVEARAIGPRDFGRDEGQEVLILTRTTRGGTEKPFEDEEGQFVQPETDHGRRVDYADTPETLAIRERIHQLGRFLAAADIAYLGQDPGVDTRTRVLRRHFSLPRNAKVPAFDLGGRLHCEGLTNIPKRERHLIRLDGEPVAVLDFGAMFPRLAYGLVGAAVPDGDPYKLPGFSEDHRDGIKMAFNAFLFGAGRRRKARWPEEVREALPAHATTGRLRDAIWQRHPSLRALAGTEREIGIPVGYRLMFLESQIMVAILEELGQRGVSAIGIHDGLMVPCSKAAEVLGIMEKHALSIGGITIPVTIK